MGRAQRGGDERGVDVEGVEAVAEALVAVSPVADGLAGAQAEEVVVGRGLGEGRRALEVVVDGAARLDVSRRCEDEDDGERGKRTG